jgi:nucleoid-associated protein YgaU
MTKETKIGLLVGLAFLIVIGILLSDHFHGMDEPPPATLNGAGANVRQAVIAPGANQPVVPAVVAPDTTTPTAVVQTTRDMEPQPSPVIVSNNPPQQGQSAGLPANDPLQQAAHQQGQELVTADSMPAAPVTTMAAEGTYKAAAGDTVSRMALKLLGANTYKNRQAIIAANPSLQDDPDMVVVGRTYTIPGATRSTTSAAPAPTLAAASGGPWVYRVREGDTLWGIATGQLNNPGAVDSIKELNSDILHGGSTIQPGMKIRLPSAPVAVAN